MRLLKEMALSFNVEFETKILSDGYEMASGPFIIIGTNALLIFRISRIPEIQFDSFQT